MSAISKALIFIPRSIGKRLFGPMVFFAAESQVATRINWCAAILPVRYPVFIIHPWHDGGLLGVHWQLDVVWNWRRVKCIGSVAVFIFLPISPLWLSCKRKWQEAPPVVSFTFRFEGRRIVSIKRPREQFGRIMLRRCFSQSSEETADLFYPHFLPTRSLHHHRSIR